MDCVVCNKQVPEEDPEQASYVRDGQVLCSYMCYEIAGYAKLPQPQQTNLEFVDAAE